MTIEEFLKQPAAVVAAVAAVLAAMISAFTIIVGALVNARTARAVAKDTFRRQMLLESVKPFLERLNNQISTYQKLLESGSAVVVALDTLESAKPEQWKAQLEALQAWLKVLHAELLQTRELWRNTSGMSLIMRDQHVMDVATSWLRSSSTFLNLMTQSPYGITADRTRLGEARKAAFDVLRKAVDLRMVLEDLVVESPGWCARTGYRVTRLFRKQPASRASTPSALLREGDDPVAQTAPARIPDEQQGVRLGGAGQTNPSAPKAQSKLDNTDAPLS